MPAVLNLEKPLVLDDGEYRMLERTSSVMTLMRLADRKITTLPLSEVGRRARDVSTTRLSVPTQLDVLSPDVRQEVHQRNLHIEEVLFGTRAGRKTPNPLFALERSKSKRVESKADELDVAPRTIWRWLDKYEQDPATAGADRRGFPRFGRMDKLTPELRAAFVEVLDAYPDHLTLLKSWLVERVEKRYEANTGLVAPKLSPTTWNKYLDVMSGRVDVTASAKKRQTDDRRPKGIQRGRVTSRSGELVEMDATKLDVECIMPTGKRGRITIASAIDVHSAKCLAMTFASINSRTTDQVSLVAQMTTQPRNRPGLTSHRARLQQLYPKHKLLTGEEYERLILDQPFVYPNQVTVDNGPDYTGAAFLGALRRARISIVFAPPGSPGKKPHIERFNLEIAKFAQTLPGAVGNSPTNRGKETPLSELLSFDMVMALITDWAFGTYNYKPVNRVQLDNLPAMRLSPNQVVEIDSGVARPDVLRFPATEDEYIRGLPLQDRKLDDQGIHFKQRKYWSDELHPLLSRAQLNPGLPDYRIQFHYDVDIHEFIWVIAPDGRLIKCEPKNAERRLNRPHQVERDAAMLRRADRAAVAVVAGAVSGVPAVPYIEAVVSKNLYAAPVEEPAASRGAFDPTQSPF